MTVRLRVVSDGDPNAVRTFTPPTNAWFVVGREDDADCVLEDDPKVSRHHCQIEHDSEGWSVRDLGSTNGFQVNGVAYGGKNGKRGADGSVPSVSLKLGDSVRVGGSTLVLVDPTLHDTTPEETASRQPIKSDLDLQPLDQFCDACGKLVAANSVAVVGGRTLCFTCRASTAKVAPAAAPAGSPKVNGYEIVRQVGDGGMGRVFLACRVSDGAEVAIKLLSVDHTTDLLAFKREMAIMRSLRHENIVAFHEAGHTAEGRPYIIMEYMPGGTLHQMIRARKAIPVAEALPLIRQMLSGLSAAHALGIIHRDIKPLNVMLDGSRKVAKLMDFGLAKGDGFLEFTKTGAAAGSINYLPPEQLSNYKRVTPTADVFALAALCYEMLSGTSPYTVKDGDFVSAVLNHDMMPLEKRCPALPAGLTRLLDRALAKDPGDRFADAGEMLSAFDRL